MSTKRDSDIERRAKAGESMAYIAGVHDISRERVRQVLRRRGIEPEDRKALAIQAARLVANEDVTITAAAQATGASMASVRRELSNLGFDPVEVRRRQADDEAQRRVEGKGSTTCTRCGKVKRWGEFTLTSRGGRQTRKRVCRDCTAKVSRAWYQVHRTKTPEPTVTEATCSNCGETKPRGEFWRNQATATGLQSWCKLCAGRDRHERERG